jgi:hypothetical protein
MKGREVMKNVLTRTVIISLILVGLGFAGLAYVSARSIDFASALLSNLASAVLTIGVVALVYEWFMRRAITADLLDLVGLKQNLSDAGIQEVTEEARLDWGEVLTGGSDFELLLVDPTAWYEREWSYILSAGRQRAIHLQLYLPDPDAHELEALAISLALQPDEFRQTVKRVARQVEDGWKTARAADEPIKTGSSIQISLYMGFPTHALLRADDEVVLLLYASLGRQPGTQATALRFRRTTDGKFPAAWFDAQFRMFRDANFPAVYADEVR